jgi:hypothetical protein
MPGPIGYSDSDDFGIDIDEQRRDSLSALKVAAARREHELQTIFRQDMTEWMVAQSVDADTSKVRRHRYVLSQFVLDTPTSNPTAIQDAYQIALVFHQFLEAAGLEEFDEYNPKLASLHWKKIHRTKSRKTVAELDKRLTFIETTLSKAFQMKNAQLEKKTQRSASCEESEIPEWVVMSVLSVQQAISEAEKAKWEAKKAFLEFADKLASLLIKASAGFTLAIGTLYVTGVPLPWQNQVTIKVESHTVGPKEATDVSKEILGRGLGPLSAGKHQLDPLDEE